jgi:hypothetical protein
VPIQACEHLSPLRVPEVYVLVFLCRHIYHTDDEKPATRNMREKTGIEKTGFYFVCLFPVFVPLPDILGLLCMLQRVRIELS